MILPFMILGVVLGGATFAVAKKKQLSTGGSAVAGIAVGAATAWVTSITWPVILAGGVVYYVVKREKKLKALNPAK